MGTEDQRGWMLDNLNNILDTQRRSQGSGSTDTDMVELVQVKTILMGEVGAGKTLYTSNALIYQVKSSAT